MIEDEHKVLALAAGIAGAELSDTSDRTPDYWRIKHRDGVWRQWDPLNDDGDALRLAVKLSMFNDPGRYVVFISHFQKISREPDIPPSAATRYAIISAAINIAKVEGK